MSKNVTRACSFLYRNCCELDNNKDHENFNIMYKFFTLFCGFDLYLSFDDFTNNSHGNCYELKSHECSFLLMNLNSVFCRFLSFDFNNDKLRLSLKCPIPPTYNTMKDTFIYDNTIDVESSIVYNNSVVCTQYLYDDNNYPKLHLINRHKTVTDDIEKGDIVSFANYKQTFVYFNGKRLSWMRTDNNKKLRDFLFKSNLFNFEKMEFIDYESKFFFIMLMENI